MRKRVDDSDWISPNNTTRFACLECCFSKKTRYGNYAFKCLKHELDKDEPYSRCNLGGHYEK